MHMVLATPLARTYLHMVQQEPLAISSLLETIAHEGSPLRAELFSGMTQGNCVASRRAVAPVLYSCAARESQQQQNHATASF